MHDNINCQVFSDESSICFHFRSVRYIIHAHLAWYDKKNDWPLPWAMMFKIIHDLKIIFPICIRTYSYILSVEPKDWADRLLICIYKDINSTSLWLTIYSLNLQVSNTTLTSFEEWCIILEDSTWYFFFFFGVQLDNRILDNRHFHVECFIVKVCVFKYLCMKMKYLYMKMKNLSVYKSFKARVKD